VAQASSERRWFGVLGGPFFVADEGVLPSWALGVGLGVGARVNRFEALLRGVLFLPQTDVAANASSYAGRYERRSGEVSACYEWPLGPMGISPCATLGLEDVTASATGPYLVGGPGHKAWLTAGLAATARWSPRPWTALFVRPNVSLSTSRPTFVIDAVGSLYQVALVTVGLDIGCEWIL